MNVCLSGPDLIKRAAVKQIDKNRNAGYDRKVSEDVVLCLLCIRLHSCRLVTVPIPTPVHELKRACEHQNEAIKEGCLV